MPFEDYFGSRVEFYKAVEFIFIHLNMSKMITFYKDRNLTIPKPAIENSYVESIFRAFLVYLFPMLFINLGLLYTKCVSLMVTLSDTNSFNIINA
jgi:hypothetical protein